MITLLPDFEKLLTHLHRGGSYSYWWTSEGKRSWWWPAGSPAPLPDGQFDLYYGVHPTAAIPTHTYITGQRAGQPKPTEEVRAKIEDVCAVNAIFAEFDSKDFPGGKDQALDHICNLSPAPSALVDSGGGYHAYWLLESPALIEDESDRARLRSLQARWVRHVLADPGSKDLARVLRVPGTRNYKPKYAPNFPEVAFVWFEATTYTLEDFIAAMPEEEKYIAVVAPAQTHAETAQVNAAYSAERELRYARAALQGELMRLRATQKGERHTTLYASALKLGTLVGAGHLDEAAVRGALTDIISGSGWEVGKHTQTIEDGLAYGKANPRTLPAASVTPPEVQDRMAFDFVQSAPRVAPTNGHPKLEGFELAPVAPNEILPSIQINARHLRDVSNDAVDVLKRAGHIRTNLYTRGGIARLVTDERGKPAIEPVTENALRGVLTRNANFFSTRTGNEGGVYQRIEDPPQKVVQDIMALGEWPFPALEAIIEAPTVRPDGSLLDAPGYDAATRLFYRPALDCVYPEVPERPSRFQVEQVLGDLRDIIFEFPFVNEASRANMLGLMITPILRAAITGHVPLALIDATAQGSGKSYLSEIVSILATGYEPTVMSMPYQAEEWVKFITTALMPGRPVVVLDNVDREVWSPELAQMLTSSVWNARILGTNQITTIPNRAAWIANGNNIKVRGDFSSRCYWIRIDPKMSRPWLRDNFKYADIKGYVRANRGRLIAGVLTLARAWFLDGQPASPITHPMRSFTEWARVIGGILAYAGEPNFLANTDELYDSVDEEGPQWESFLNALRDKFGDGPFTVAAVCAAFTGEMFSTSTLTDLVPTTLGEPIDDHGNIRAGFKHRLGKAFSKRAGVRYGETGICITKASNASNQSVKWLIQAPNAT